jgi:outer membrane murein-binding lipoprotein Lpp
MTTGNQRNRPGRLLVAFAAVGSLVLAGCSNSNPDGPAQADGTKATTKAPPADAHAAEIKAERDKLSPDDRALVDAQEWCAISTDSRLGSMGPPLKVTVKDQPVFICCKGCQKKALADPDRTLAAVVELKAKAETDRERK